MKSLNGLGVLLITAALVVLSNAGAARAAESECVNVWYDASPDPSYRTGELYSIFLRNLLGHFPRRLVYAAPIETYRTGEIERCQASVYLGTHFFAQQPPAFLSEAASTKRNLLWLGYGIWKMDEKSLAASFGLKYQGLTTLDSEHKDAKGRPTFFKTVVYKGERFEKYGEFSDRSKSSFAAAFEMAKMQADASAQVLALVEHNGTGEKLPYMTRKANRFYVADIPFSYMHEDDRYLAFSDLLFDVLDEKPRFTGARPAVFRLEDIHARVPQYQIYDVAGPLKELNVPLHIALIPIFYDPLNKFGRAPEEELILMHDDPLFMDMLSNLAQQTTKFVWHGVTHQYKSVKNPYSAVSGDDFEFWDIRSNSPVAEDSPGFVLNRLDDGWETMAKAGVKPRFWEVPHYQASALDYLIFARVFPWNVGRIMYSPFAATGVPERNDLALRYVDAGLGGRQARLDAFGGLKVTTEGAPSGQFYPYEIYGDAYGQRVIPENLGNPQPFENRHVIHPRTIDDILRAARRNIKLRDVWGSLFFHPQLMDSASRDGIGAFPGDSSELRRLVGSMREMGYEFIDLEKFATDAGETLRPEPVITPRSAAASMYQTLYRQRSRIHVQ